MNREFLVNSIGHWQGLEQILNNFEEVLKNEADETQSLVDTKIGELKELFQKEFDDTQENQINILTKLSEVYIEILGINQKLNSILDALNLNGQQIVSAINEVRTTIENNKV